MVRVFQEKPIAPTVAAAQRVIEAAKLARKKLLVGYILRVHPSWTQFVDVARSLGGPLAMRMNLNQRDSSEEKWAHHKRTMETVSPIVDCGVHYVDVMCQMVAPRGARPLRVSAVGARMSEELTNPSMYNYGQLQVTFTDGSVGWYEAGWGPNMSETAFFVKDVIGPKGSASIVASIDDSSEISSHVSAEQIKLHRTHEEAQLLQVADTPDHDELCRREQAWLLRAIDQDEDLSQHWRDALDSLRSASRCIQPFNY
eukprot:SAG11_NODE_2878_length_2878_cov_2.849226_3_plen_256_part_00